MCKRTHTLPTTSPLLTSVVRARENSNNNRNKSYRILSINAVWHLGNQHQRACHHFATLYKISFLPFATRKKGSDTNILLLFPINRGIKPTITTFISPISLSGEYCNGENGQGYGIIMYGSKKYDTWLRGEQQCSIIFRMSFGTLSFCRFFCIVQSHQK